MTVRRVRVFGSVELWVARESLARLDALNGVILGHRRGDGPIAGRRIRDRRRPPLRSWLLARRARASWRSTSMLGLHETFGYNLDFLAGVPGVDSPEDVFFALYVIPAAPFFIFYWDLLSASRRGQFARARGHLLFAAAAASSWPRVPREQWIEPSASLALVAGLSLVAVAPSGAC